MKLFEKIKIQLKDKESRQIKFCGIPILQYTKIRNGKRHYFFPVKQKINNNAPIFYLKINRLDDYVFLCLQQWLDTISHMNRDYYILCDNKKLKKEIIKKIVFPNSNIKFLKSKRCNQLKKIVKNIATKFWIKATYAHLTTFYHAKHNNIKSFWNIDADDTLFCINPITLAEYFIKIEAYADTNNISAFSLDMHRSRTAGRHWSFGITYTQMNIDWFNILEMNTDNSWQKNYENFDYEFNLDWFFTYLHDYKNINNQTFYIENSAFIHWGNFLTNIIGSGIFYWENERLKFPIILNIIDDKYLGDIPIAQDCIKFTSNFDELQNKKYIIDNLTYLYKPSKQMLNLWKYAERSHSNELTN